MLKDYCQEKTRIIDQALERLLPPSDTYPGKIYEAMRYSVFAGGKRLRPILLMAAADAVGRDGQSYLPVACGLEMIHTYSLIHDDLPAMDNDDYRRGQPTNHKVFGEGMAILAGDALLTGAVAVMLEQTAVEADVLLRVIRDIAAAAGAGGMIGGQTVDLLSAGQQLDMETLQYMHQAKTGALFKAALRSGALLAGGTERQVDALTGYAEYFGLAFQITDDILDVTGSQVELGKPVGSDIRNSKATYVSLYSLPEARRMAQTAVDKALQSLEGFQAEADRLRELVAQLTTRNH